MSSGEKRLTSLALAAFIVFFSMSSFAQRRPCREHNQFHEHEASAADIAEALCQQARQQAPIRSAREWMQQCGQGGQGTAQRVEDTRSWFSRFGQALLQTPGNMLHTVTHPRQTARNLANFGNYVTRGTVSAVSNISAENLANGWRVIEQRTQQLLNNMNVANHAFRCAPPGMQARMMCQFIGETATGYIQGAAPISVVQRAQQINAAIRAVTPRQASGGRQVRTNQPNRSTASANGSGQRRAAPTRRNNRPSDTASAAGARGRAQASATSGRRASARGDRRRQPASQTQATLQTAELELAEITNERVITTFANGGRLRETTSATGRRRVYVDHPTEVVDVNTGRMVRRLEADEVPRNRQGVFTAQSAAGRAYAENLAYANRGGHMVMMDLNYLSRVNYFQHGTRTRMAAGDRYIERYTEIVRREVRDADLQLVNNGGDELIMFLPNRNPEEVRQVMQRIVTAVHNDAELNQMFASSRRGAAAAVPRGQTPTAEDLQALQEISRLRPGISIGAARIEGANPTAAFTSTMSIAEAEAASFKNYVRSLHGTNDGKQGMLPVDIGRRPHPSLEPVVPPISPRPTN